MKNDPARPERPGSRLYVAILALLALPACAASGHAPEPDRLRAAGATGAEEAAALFLFGDFGGLSGHALESALPYKLMVTALVLEREAREAREGRVEGPAAAGLGPEDIASTFAHFGLISGAEVANWPGPESPPFERPMGVVAGMVKGPLPFVRFQGSTFGCSSCHSGRLYDARGEPMDRVWLGLPNTSVDFEGLSLAVYAGLKRGLALERDSLMARLQGLFPETGSLERFTLKRFILGRARDELAELEAMADAPTLFPNGGPGRTNGVGALKAQLGLLPPARTRYPEHAYASIPELGWRPLRTSLLVDGTYVPRGGERFAARTWADATRSHTDSLAHIVAFFTVPTMGVAPRDVPDAIPDVTRVMRWLGTSHAPPPFPGPVDAALAAEGARLFEARCAACHGRYDDDARPRRLAWYPNRLVAQAEMGTDPVRWTAVDTAAVRVIDRVYGRYIEAARTGGYVAPILSGLWATAPYLHNGSVPTLWHLLKPETRPTAFQVGGHRLDWERLGIDGRTGADGVYRYPDGYRPWSRPETYDTRAPGLSNAGHEREFAPLTDGDRRALIEYLKGL